MTNKNIIKTTNFPNQYNNNYNSFNDNINNNRKLNKSKKWDITHFDPSVSENNYYNINNLQNNENVENINNNQNIENINNNQNIENINNNQNIENINNNQNIENINNNQNIENINNNKFKRNRFSTPKKINDNGYYDLKNLKSANNDRFVLKNSIDSKSNNYPTLKNELNKLMKKNIYNNYIQNNMNAQAKMQ